MIHESEQIDLLIGADFLYPMRSDGEIVMGGEVAIRSDKIVYAGPCKGSGFWAPKRKISVRTPAFLFWATFVVCTNFGVLGVLQSLPITLNSPSD